MLRTYGAPWMISMFLALSAASPRFVLAQDELGKRERPTIAIQWSEFETKHYAVRHESVIPRTTAEKVANAVEDALAQYIGLFRFEPKEKLKIKFLDSLNTYEQEGGDPSHPGHYNPRDDCLVLRQMPFYDLIPMAYHEAFHQYLAKYLGPGAHAPTWFNEGLAVYFEGMQLSRGTKKPDVRLIDNRKIGQVQRALMTRSAIPFKQLIDATHKEFHDKEREALHYAQSFSVVYFLMQGSGMRTKLFRFARSLKQTKDLDQAYEVLFGKDWRNLAAVERSWKAFTARLKLHDGTKG